MCKSTKNNAIFPLKRLHIGCLVQMFRILWCDSQTKQQQNKKKKMHSCLPVWLKETDRHSINGKRDRVHFFLVF